MGTPLIRPDAALNEMPGGNAPVNVNVGVGVPVAVTVKLLAVPTTKAVLLALVKTGAVLPAPLRVKTKLAANGAESVGIEPPQELS